MFQTDRTIQPSLFAFSHRDLISEDSDVWLYIDLFNQIDFLDFDSAYVSQGQEAKDPKLMLRTIFYALTHGICSGHKLSEVCRNDNRYIVLSGDTRPDRRTFDRFLKRHEAALQDLFVQIVRMAQLMGLVRLGRVAIDGSKFKAFAGKLMQYEKMCRAMEHINKNLETLKKDLTKANADEATEISSELEDKIKNEIQRRELIQRAKEQIDREYEKQITIKEWHKKKRKPRAMKALHDPEALSLGASADFLIGYNAQAAVDDCSQIVVAADLHDSSSDTRALPKILDQVVETCGTYPDKTLADGGYYSLENLNEIKQRGSVPYVAPQSDPDDIQPQAIEQIRKNNDKYYCLANKELKVKCKTSDGYILLSNSREPIM